MPWTLSEIPEEDKIKVMLEKDRLVQEAPYHPGYEDAVMGYTDKPIGRR
jgi:hypothetical protein